MILINKVEHVLIIHSAYSMNKRVAFHSIIKDISDYYDILDRHVALLKTFPDVISFSLHFLETECNTAQSISAKDCYFKGVDYMDCFDSFKNIVKKDLTSLNEECF